MINILKAITFVMLTTFTLVLKADEVFVGCVPSFGECRNSCVDHNSRVETDAPQCLFEIDSLGCFCGTPNELPPVKVPEGFMFIGCRPSAGECMNSCPSRSGMAQDSPEICKTGYDLEPFACYCSR